MAGAGYKLFNTGDVLTAAQVNTYLQEQAVMRFANAAARTTALSGVLAEGMMSYLDDTNSVEVYNGSAWVSVGSTGDITGVTAGTGISGGGTSGDVTITNSMATAIDAKGDLIVGTGADTFARLAVGTNGHTLVADSSTATGLKWQAPGGGGLVLISTTTFTSSSAVNIDSVFSSTYRNYRIIVNFTDSTNENTQMRLRSGGTTYTGSTYEQRGYKSTSSLANILNNTQAQWTIGEAGVSRFGASIDIYAPFISGFTAMTSTATGLSSGTAAAGMATNSWIDTSRSDDGFTIYGSSGGLLTGTIQVFGYKE